MCNRTETILLLTVVLTSVFRAVWPLSVCLVYDKKVRVCPAASDGSCEYVKTLTEYEHKNDVYIQYGVSAININGCQQRDDENIDYNKVKAIDRGNLFGQLNLDDYPETNTIVILHYANNSIRSLHKEQFKNVKHVMYLNVNHNLIDTIDDDTFDALPNLVEFLAQHNVLSKLPRVGSLQKLSYLDLSYNEITHVDSVLNKLTQLSRLTLAHNKIKTLEYCTFCNLKNLYVLDLSWNDIEILPDNFTTGMSGLDKLNVQNNKLTKITDEIFSEIRNQMFVLSLAYNEISYIAPYSFHALNDLEYLYINDNKLEVIPNFVFEGLRGVNDLDLSNNSIVEFKPDSMRMRQLSSLQNVFINNNKLTFLYGELIEKLKFRVRIHIQGNPWQCACLDDMLKRFKEREIVYDYYKEGKVVRPGRQLVCVEIYKSPDFCVKDIALTENFDTIFFWAMKRYDFTDQDFHIGTYTNYLEQRLTIDFPPIVFPLLHGGPFA